MSPPPAPPRCHVLELDAKILVDGTANGCPQSTKSTIATISKPDEESAKSGKKGGGGSFGSVGAKFVKSLKELMTQLSASQAHFVRCVKPNPELKPGVIHGENVVDQLRMSGTLDAIKLIQSVGIC